VEADGREATAIALDLVWFVRCVICRR